LDESYGLLISKVNNFIPEGKSAEYVSSFKKSMTDLILPLQHKVKEFRREAKKQIEANGILSESNPHFLGKDGVNQIKFFSLNHGILMDREGGK